MNRVRFCEPFKAWLVVWLFVSYRVRWARTSVCVA